MTKVLMFGATGGCGRQALIRLLERGVFVTVVVRDASRLPKLSVESPSSKGYKLLTVKVVPEGHLHMTSQEYLDLVEDMDAVILALGHTMSCKGIFGGPFHLCENSVKKVCDAIDHTKPKKKVKLIVISTEGVDIPNKHEEKSFYGHSDMKRPCPETCLLYCCLKMFLPPHRDNIGTMQWVRENLDTKENAHLRKYIDFCLVRPSNLVDAEQSEYMMHKTLQSGIFAKGVTTSRANAGDFMANCVTDESVWSEWKNSYPHVLDVPDPMVDNKKKPTSPTSRGSC
eukprot:gene504-597_t